MQSLHVTTRTPRQQITAVLDLYDRKALGQIVIDGESRGGGRTLNNDFWDSSSIIINFYLCCILSGPVLDNFSSASGLYSVTRLSVLLMIL